MQIPRKHKARYEPQCTHGRSRIILWRRGSGLLYDTNRRADPRTRRTCCSVSVDVPFCARSCRPPRPPGSISRAAVRSGILPATFCFGSLPRGTEAMQDLRRSGKCLRLTNRTGGSSREHQYPHRHRDAPGRYAVSEILTCEKGTVSKVRNPAGDYPYALIKPPPHPGVAALALLAGTAREYMAGGQSRRHQARLFGRLAGLPRLVLPSRCPQLARGSGDGRFVLDRSECHAEGLDPGAPAFRHQPGAPSRRV